LNESEEESHTEIISPDFYRFVKEEDPKNELSQTEI
jgi:hypothetical protein